MSLVLTSGREGVHNLENLADVICASPPCSLALRRARAPNPRRAETRFRALFGSWVSPSQI